MRKTKGNESIKAENIILCEGADDKAFLTCYINHIMNEQTNKQFQVLSFDGKRALSEYMRNLHLMTGFAHVKSIIILRDADFDNENSEKSITNALKRAGYATPDKLCEIAEPKDNDRPQRTAYCLFPSILTSKSGTLEDLCLEILRNPNDIRMYTVQKSIDAIQLESEKYSELRLVHHSKNKLHSYFSLTNDYVGCKIGNAAERKAFDFESPKLEPLRNLLFNMLKNCE